MYYDLRTDYNYMQMRFEKMMQDHNVKEVKVKEVFDGNFKEKKRTENGGVLGARKFMDLGLASNKVKEVKGQEVSNGKFGDKKRMKNDGELMKRKFVDVRLDTNKIKEMFNGKCEKKKRTENGGELVQRKCRDIVLITNAETVMDHEASSSSMRNPRSKDQLGSTMKSIEVSSKELVLSNNEDVNVDTAEAILSKARVTIRARSEETMVSMLNCILTFNFASFYIINCCPFSLKEFIFIVLDH